MLWQNEWKAISARCEALTQAAELVLKVSAAKPIVPFGMEKTVRRQMQDATSDIYQFQEIFDKILPCKIAEVFKKFFWTNHIPEYIHNQGQGTEAELMCCDLLALNLLISEVNYYMTNTSEVVKRQSERAFLHLQQSIAAAEDIQQRWQQAFDKDEPACEKLGAAHLLLHGIYAFKVNAEGARTDLVFPDRSFNTNDVQRTADGLVLTEWKKVKTQTEASTKAEQARKQAASYNSGILGGIELANYRYIVLVSEEQLNRIDDVEENSVIYRHINIAVMPLSPSKAAVK